MKNTFNKLFRKNEVVKIILLNVDKRIKTYYVIPKGKDINIKDNTYQLDDKNFFLDSKGYITYVFSYKNVLPYDIDSQKFGDITPADMNVALESRVASEIFKSTTKEQPLQTIIYVLIGVVILGLLAVYYALSNDINSILEYLYEINGGGIV